MTISEQSRHAMYVQLESVLGQEAALILMEHLPPVGWADVATKRDLDQHRAATKSDLDQHRAATKSDLDHHRASTKSDLDQLHMLMQRDLAVGIGELRREMSAQTRTIVFSVIGAMVSLAALNVTAVQLG